MADDKSKAAKADTNQDVSDAEARAKQAEADTKAAEQREKDQAEATKAGQSGRTTNETAATKKSRARAQEKTEANEQASNTNDGAPDKPSDLAKDRDKLLKRFAAVREELFDLDLELNKFGERELADVVKRARREFELTERLGIPQARGL